MQCIVSCCLRFAAVLVIAREGIVVAKNETTTVEVAAIIGIAAEESATTAWQDQSAEKHLDYSNQLSLVLLLQSAENFNFVAATSSSVVIIEVSCSTFIV